VADFVPRKRRATVCQIPEKEDKEKLGHGEEEKKMPGPEKKAVGKG